MTALMPQCFERPAGHLAYDETSKPFAVFEDFFQTSIIFNQTCSFLLLRRYQDLKSALTIKRTLVLVCISIFETNSRPRAALQVGT